MKTATIIESVYSSTWLNPKTNSNLYFYAIKFDNGEIGKAGVQVMNSARVAVGTKVDYTLTADKIKIETVHSSAGAVSPVVSNTIQKTSPIFVPIPQDNNITLENKKRNRMTKKPEDFLGFTYGYAKDITVQMIASGNKEVIADPAAYTIKIADVLFDKICDTLDGK